MTLSVRLPWRVEESLAEYCVEHGVTKSAVVQQALAAYLPAAAEEPGVYARLRAGGLLDEAAPSLLGGEPATKEGMRRALRRRLRPEGA